MTESFLRSEIEQYKNSRYKIISHIFSNAKETFMLSQWAISQIIFDKDNGEEINDNSIKADRYELENGEFNFKRTYFYNNSRPNLIKEIDKKIKDTNTGMILGNVSYLEDCINLTNKVSKNSNTMTTNNIKWCLLSKGLCFNNHHKYLYCY